jgi:alginate O-acetyltransferase complex protein AlgI
MAFTSASFFLYFLPIFLILFRISSSGGVRLSNLAKATIIIGTYVFYGFENIGYLLPFIIATLMDLIWSQCLKRTMSPLGRKWIVACSILQNLSIFFVFKYVNWMAASFPHVQMFQVLQRTFADTNGTIALPPGVSFYLFESLSFVIDCYRREIETPENPIDFLSFISMLPRFIAGPIVRYKDLQKSIQNYSGMRVADGLFIFAIGFSIKILLADSFEKFVTPLFGHDFSFFSTWTCALAYTFQIYLDFSGYSLMAIGIGMTIGFPFLDNFREPYLADSISDFWRRWHISLSTWLRDYLYISLGGNRKGQLRTQMNLILTMLIGGLWHGANATYLIWGFYHGIILAMEKQFGIVQKKVLRRVLTFLIVLLGWVFFRADSLKEAGKVFKGLGGFSGFSIIAANDIVSRNIIPFIFGVGGIIWIFSIEPSIRKSRGNLPWNRFELSQASITQVIFVLCIFVLAVVFALSAHSIPFLYFQF